MPEEDTMDREHPVPDPGADDEDLRRLALARLRDRRDLRGHVLVYLAVNGTFVLVWAVTGMPFFWPVFPIVFWGVGLTARAWDAYGHRDVSEKRIRREANRVRRGTRP